MSASIVHRTQVADLVLMHRRNGLFYVDDFVYDAVQFAACQHVNQVRKYTGEPYIVHPLEVMRIVDLSLRVDGVKRSQILAAAVLHDVVEDCDVKREEIEDQFGPAVARIVDGLTDVSRPEDGNRARRKAIDLAHLAEQGWDVQTIKLADIVSNARSIAKYDPKFAAVYLPEKRAQIGTLTRGMEGLRQLAIETVRR